MHLVHPPRNDVPGELKVVRHHVFSFQNGGAVEFASQMKSLRDDTGFRVRLYQVTGQFPVNGPEILTLFVETADFDIASVELREKILAHVPLPRKKSRPHESQNL